MPPAARRSPLEKSGALAIDPLTGEFRIADGNALLQPSPFNLLAGVQDQCRDHRCARDSGPLGNEERSPHREQHPPVHAPQGQSPSVGGGLVDL